MPTTRPDPDELLRRVHEQELRARRGRLKIFFGASPGVGKTFSMLEAAQAARRQGLEVVVGVVETHGRAETERLTERLEILPRRRVEYHGTNIDEFDLDGALARHPGLLLVDELAHTNAPGSRHTKRWQDVEELLSAGVNVWSTLNVQHVESLNDVVAQITGVRVRETVPDSVLEQADEVEMVDLTPDELIQRLRDGKVYLPEQASRAVDQFFRKGNLIALREMALRRTAERVDAQMRGYMAEQGIRETWATSERLLVCVDAGPEGTRLVRAGRRIAEGLAAPWSVVHVESPASPGISGAISQTLELADQLGAEVVTLSGLDPVEEVLAYARAHNVTRLVVAPPGARPFWRRWRPGVVDRLVRQSGRIDVQVVTGDEAGPGPATTSAVRAAPGAPRQYVEAVLVPALVTAGALLVRPTGLATIDAAMLFLLGVVVVSARHSRGPSLVTSALSILFFDFFFVPPYYTFSVSDVSYVLTFGVMLAVALVMETLTGRVRSQALSARERERRTATLYAFSRDLATARLRPDLARVTLQHLRGLFGGSVSLLLPEDDGRLILVAELPAGHGSDKELSVARWVFDRGQPAGLGTATLPAAEMLYVPLSASGHRLGVIGVRPDPPERMADPGQRQLLETIVDQTALALERSALANAARQAHLEAEAEKLRTSLLSSLSHDMRTPLASIQGAASALLSDAGAPDESVRRDLAETILEESRRMDRLVANLLDMIRLESGAMQVEREWHVLEEVVGVALLRLGERVRDHVVTTSFPRDLPMVPADDVLLEQVFVNLLENAAKHTPPGTPVEIGARAVADAVEIWVADRGPGLPADGEKRIFEKFQRGSGAAPGVGLGLTIVRGIVRAHRGEIHAEQRPGGGAIFRFTLPLIGTQPVVPPEEDNPS